MYICNNKIVIDAKKNSHQHIIKSYSKNMFFLKFLYCGSVFAVLTETSNRFHRLAVATANQRLPCVTVYEASTDNKYKKADLSCQFVWLSNSLRKSSARPFVAEYTEKHFIRRVQTNWQPMHRSNISNTGVM